MDNSEMTSLERVFATLSHKEPDRVPMFLLVTMHGAKELGMTLKEYFSKAENVVEGQLRMRKKYRNDCYYPFFYAPLETEAFGGDTIFIEDGPPNSGEPIIKKMEQINSLVAPKVKDAKVLHKVLEAIKTIKEKVQNDAPIIGVAMSPFSLPVMQMGFDKYLELMHFYPDLFNKLMQVNEEFCVDWANAQLEAGATAICYFDPVSSTTIIPREKYLETGFKIAKRTISMIKGATATHLASGNCLPIIDDIAQTGTLGIGVSALENINELKAKCLNKISILGNLNGIEMRNWNNETAAVKVKNLIESAAPGGGFILADNHGEIPYQVPDEVLVAISDAVYRYGKYPIRKVY